MSFRLAGSARVAIAAVSIMMGAAACGSAEPGAEPTAPVTVLDTSLPLDGRPDTPLPDNGPSDTVAPGSASSTSASAATSATSAGPTTTSSSTSSDPTVPLTAATVIVELGVSEAEVAELEQQLDEIDRVLADLEAQLSED